MDKEDIDFIVSLTGAVQTVLLTSGNGIAHDILQSDYTKWLRAKEQQAKGSGDAK